MHTLAIIAAAVVLAWLFLGLVLGLVIGRALFPKPLKELPRYRQPHGARGVVKAVAVHAAGDNL